MSLFLEVPRLFRRKHANKEQDMIIFNMIQMRSRWWSLWSGLMNWWEQDKMIERLGMIGMKAWRAVLKGDKGLWKELEVDLGVYWEGDGVGRDCWHIEPSKNFWRSWSCLFLIKIEAITDEKIWLILIWVYSEVGTVNRTEKVFPWEELKKNTGILVSEREELRDYESKWSLEWGQNKGHERNFWLKKRIDDGCFREIKLIWEINQFHILI